MTNNDLYCLKCKSHHHPVECPLEFISHKEYKERTDRIKKRYCDEIRGMVSKEKVREVLEGLKLVDGLNSVYKQGFNGAIDKALKDLSGKELLDGTENSNQ